MTKKEQNLGLRAHSEWLEQGNSAMVDELFSEDAVIHSRHVPPALRQGREGIRAYGASLQQAFPDLRFVNEVVADDENGEFVAIIYKFRGTNTGSFMGLPATGKRIEMGGADVFRIVDGKIRELYLEQDLVGLMQQLGVIPTRPG
ncbi:ester cyclase [Corallococcus llansteffanensis]|uniref:Ester cyclase n=1 Tax=Corallococcus llansteffanensis TaxID=2316731 RepID=A0A3A8Q341_9BACT|nr:ester cyclase [Corallococcus llansteffanensis]RKH59292.1 ester cyclase [Corallococcus llansteffanensis]